MARWPDPHPHDLQLGTTMYYVCGPVTPIVIDTGTMSVTCPIDNVTFTRASAV